MTERAELMGIYRSNGISSISLMRDHYNKYDDGGDIQPSDATFRATLTNPVNSYRSNAPAGIGDAAITKATGRDRAFIKRAHAEGISDEEANNRLNYNLKVSLDAVRKDIINKYGYEAWDTMYPSLKRGLTDIRFNVGPNKEYPKATEAAIRNNIEQFMKEQKDGRSPRRVDSINTLFIDQLKNL